MGLWRPHCNHKGYQLSYPLYCFSSNCDIKKKILSVAPGGATIELMSYVTASRDAVLSRKQSQRYRRKRIRQWLFMKGHMFSRVCRGAGRRVPSGPGVALTLGWPPPRRPSPPSASSRWCNRVSWGQGASRIRFGSRLRSPRGHEETSTLKNHAIAKNISILLVSLLCTFLVCAVDCGTEDIETNVQICAYRTISKEFLGLILFALYFTPEYPFF